MTVYMMKKSPDRDLRRTALMKITGVIVALAAAITPAAAATYEVGPGRQYSSIGAVPWESLQAGDVVLIHHRSDPYREKWVLNRRGTSANPIVVRGVAGPNGELPVVSGDGATTRSQLSFWNENRGVLKIGGSDNPPDTTPEYLVIESLEIRSGRSPYTFRNSGGSTQSYTDNAASIYVESGRHLVIRNCIIRDSGNGLFIASNDDEVSSDILVENNHIYDNGIDGSVFQHNSYTAAQGITFQFNHYGPLRSGASGNNLKDRSSGLVIRYNWIEGGNRQLDIVEAEDSIILRNDPAYHQTYVYGNILIEPAGAGNRQMIHYGGDSGDEPTYRKGTMYLYNNTFISTRTDRTTIMRLSTNGETADARNNVFYVSSAGSNLALLDDAGVLNVSHNFAKAGWQTSAGGGTLNDDRTWISAGPGFVDEGGQDFRPSDSSPLKDAGGSLNSAVLPTHNLNSQYGKHQQSVTRPSDGRLDVGAFESGTGTSGPPTPPAPAPPQNVRIIR